MTNLLNNPSFLDRWTTLPDGNQVPDGWKIGVADNGVFNIWPTKMQQGLVVESRAERQPEIVHKLNRQLPEEERLGGPRALVLDAITDEDGAVILEPQVLKSFHGPSSLQLSQTVQGLLPETEVKFTCYILAKTEDIPRGVSGKLEPDHCRVRIAIDGETTDSVDTQYEFMNVARDVEGNELPWNKLEVVGRTDTYGEVMVRIQVQQNWPNDPTGVAFFYGPCFLEYTEAPAPPQDDLQDLLADVRLLQDDLETISDDINIAFNRLSAIEEKLRDLIGED